MRWLRRWQCRRSAHKLGVIHEEIVGTKPGWVMCAGWCRICLRHVSWIEDWRRTERKSLTW